jgi:hypothetical protein
MIQVMSGEKTAAGRPEEMRRGAVGG